MFWRDSFIAPDRSDFECLLKSPCHQSFLPKLSSRNTKKYIGIISIVVSLERTRISSASCIFQAWRIKLNKSRIFKKSPHTRKVLTPSHYACMYFWIKHIEIPLTISRLYIRKSMMFIWEWTKRLGEKLYLFSKDCSFSFFCTKTHTIHSEKITSIDIFLNKIITIKNYTININIVYYISVSCEDLWWIFSIYSNLYHPGMSLNIEKSHPSVHPLSDDTSSECEGCMTI